ncbi:sensor histidine kinase [Actinomadura sp. SCN-SB]|uniref:sensor histidine kinase n=1 Tax=Actinomadura sp. SCN-SB TaxID=3373092 RepID=UPI003751D38C
MRYWVAGVSLGLLAVLETVLRTGGAVSSVAVLVGLQGTAPLAFARGHGAVAGTAIATAVPVTMLLYHGVPAVTGLVALAAVAVPAARRRLRRARAHAAERDELRRAARDTMLELTARGERARIARELHDVVAHHISMISVRAETARVAVPGMPEQGAEHLRAIGDTARTALTEMRRLLGVLREDAGDAPPERRPQPGLQQLLELVDQSRDGGGARTRLIVRGPVTALDAGVELTAYRIVQEALTNARRHAPGAAVDVEIGYDDDALRLRVRDNGPGPPPSGARVPGHGLAGMRERAAAVGGRLGTGAAPGGGFLVEATLPTGPEEGR